MEIDAPRFEPLAMPALATAFRRAVIAHADGTIDEPAPEAVLQGAASTPYLVAHANLTFNRLGRSHREGKSSHFDVLDLFAFVRPAQPIAPSIGAIARALGHQVPRDLAAQALFLRQAANELLSEAQGWSERERKQAARIAAAMALSRWAWAPL